MFDDCLFYKMVILAFELTYNLVWKNSAVDFAMNHWVYMIHSIVIKAIAT
jgi:hypothetical protein